MEMEEKGSQVSNLFELSGLNGRFLEEAAKESDPVLTIVLSVLAVTLVVGGLVGYKWHRKKKLGEAFWGCSRRSAAYQGVGSGRAAKYQRQSTTKSVTLPEPKWLQTAAPAMPPRGLPSYEMGKTYDQA